MSGALVAWRGRGAQVPARVQPKHTLTEALVPGRVHTSIW